MKKSIFLIMVAVLSMLTVSATPVVSNTDTPEIAYSQDDVMILPALSTLMDDTYIMYQNASSHNQTYQTPKSVEVKDYVEPVGVDPPWMSTIYTQYYKTIFRHTTKIFDPGIDPIKQCSWCRMINSL